MSVKLIASICVWNDDRFLRPVLDSALASMNSVWVTMAYEPWNHCEFTKDNTESIVDEYSDRIHVIKGNWFTESDQRNAAIPGIQNESDGDTYLVIMDADEVYCPRQIDAVRVYLEHNKPTLAYVKQRVYFKHGNWIVEPDTHIAEAFVLLHDNFRFTDCRGNNCLTTKIINHIPEDIVVVHHFNTVGTRNEMRVKHESFSHADIVKPGWLDKWSESTIESKNLHQVVPELLPGLRKVEFSTLPSVCWPYKDSFLLDEL